MSVLRAIRCRIRECSKRADVCQVFGNHGTSTKRTNKIKGGLRDKDWIRWPRVNATAAEVPPQNGQGTPVNRRSGHVIPTDKSSAPMRRAAIAPAPTIAAPRRGSRNTRSNGRAVDATCPRHRVCPVCPVFGVCQVSRVDGFEPRSLLCGAADRPR